MNLSEKLSKHLSSIKEGQFIYLEVKRPSAPYSNNRYDAGMLNQQTGKVEIAVNPSSNELSQLLKDSEKMHLRGEFSFRIDPQTYEPSLKDVYFWDATKMVHDEIQRYLSKKDDVSLSIVIDNNRQVVKENIWQVEDDDGCPDAEAAIAWGKLIISLIKRYSLKLNPKDQKRLNNWLKGRSYTGEEIEEFD